ncbi:MAG: baseplate J/gp47 family protein [Pseudonocardiaceae bacterium]|nr:baseplate J/gp47 family protein [Pseudonocardiaceae bacterium]
MDQLAALVGITRRGVTHARGEVVFRRATPAPADITVLAGTLVSTAQAPLVTVETTQTAALRRGTLSVALAVRAVDAGPAGVAPARALTVIHRPIFGVEEALNPEPLGLGGGAEPDPELRSRVIRALETSGRSTVGALKAALASLEQIREQDVFIEEDHLAFPGVVRVTVAADIDPATAISASRLLEEYRPAGVRIVHNLLVPTAPPVSVAEDTGGGGDGPTPGADTEGVFVPIEAVATVTPADTQLTAEQRDRLALAAAAAVHAAVDEVGVGEPLIYNRLVAALLVTPSELAKPILLGIVTDTANYRVEDLTYRVELIDEGLRITRQDVVVPLDPGQQIWIRQVTVTERAVSS